MLAGPFPHAFEGVTCTLPEVEPTFTLIELVPCPAEIVQPEGTFQV